MQKKTIALAKKQASDENADGDGETAGDHGSMASGAAQPAAPELVPLPLAMALFCSALRTHMICCGRIYTSRIQTHVLLCGEHLLPQH